MLPHPSRLAAFLALEFLLAPVPCRLSAGTVFADTFKDGDVTVADGRGRFWSVVLPDGAVESDAREEAGHLHLRASGLANSCAGLVGPVSEDFGFFAKPLTITVDGIALEAKGIPAAEARFKLSLAATADRAEKAADVISLWIRPGLLLLGFRIDGFDAAVSPENLSGQSARSVVAAPIQGVPARISLTLGPSPTEGSILYEIHAEGNGVSFSSSGVLHLSLAQWGGRDAASLVVDVRRDHATEVSGTSAELTVGQITVSR